MRGRKITEREAEAALFNYRAFPIEPQDVLPLWPRIKSLYANLSAYDAQYVALAEALPRLFGHRRCPYRPKQSSPLRS